MASESSMTQTIYFVAAVVAATVLAGTMLTLSYQAAETMRDGSTSFSNQAQTDIVIINDPREVPIVGGAISIYAKNVGATILDPFQSTVFLDGQAMSNLTFSNLPGHSWKPGEVLEIRFAATLAPGDHALKVVTENGISATITFRVVA
ncbi:MAG TPA: hypothetical protein VEH08_04730 [Methanomassiliicoccales archaeon]|nr:hypothetical protein [Methanomassiliicoccales archaeon]